MGKLRDWWSSDDLLDRKKPSSSSSVAPTGSPPGFGSAALRLSEVAAALNALPQTPQTPQTPTDAPPPPPHTFSRPVVKLVNSQEHKDELLKKMLQGSSSSGDALQARPPRGPRSQSSSARSSKSANTVSDRSRKSSVLHALQEKPIDKDALTRREVHIYSERQRRKGMTHLYATLHSLLPEAKPKTDRCTVLTEAMDYIQSLRKKLDDLAHQKSEIMSSLGEHLNLDSAAPTDAETATRMPVELSDDVREQFLTAADVAVRFCSRDAFITLNSPKKKGIWSGILQVLHEQNMELLNVTLSTSIDTDYHCIHAKIPAATDFRSQDLQKMIQDLVLSHVVLE